MDYNITIIIWYEWVLREKNAAFARFPDADGLNYWVGNLSSGLETRYEALLGFAESAENKALFTDMTGFG